MYEYRTQLSAKHACFLFVLGTGSFLRTGMWTCKPNELPFYYIVFCLDIFHSSMNETMTDRNCRLSESRKKLLLVFALL